MIRKTGFVGIIKYLVFKGDGQVGVICFDFMAAMYEGRIRNGEI